MTDTPTNIQEQQPIVAPPLPYTIKANLVAYRKRIGMGRIGLALIITLVFYFKLGFLGWLLSTAGLAVLIVAILYILKSRTLTITSSEVTHVNFFRRQRVIPFEAIEGVKVFINYYEVSFGAVPRVIIAEKSSKSPLILSTMYWPVDEIDKLLAVLRDKNITTDYYDDVVTSAMIKQQFPSYASYAERHTWMIAIIGSFAIVAAVVGIGLLVY